MTAYLLICSVVFFVPLRFIQPIPHDWIAVQYWQSFCVYFIVFVALGTLVVWERTFLTIHWCGRARYLDYYIGRTEALLRGYISTYGTPSSSSGIVASLQASAAKRSGSHHDQESE
jgi:hypothetical protein